MNKKIIAIAIILILIVITLGVVLGLVKNEWGKQPIVENNKQPITATTTSPALNDIDTSDWKTYRNEELGFETKYPESWNVIKLSDSRAGFAMRSPIYKPLISGEVVLSGEIYLSKIPNLENLKIVDLIDTFNDESRFWPNKFKYEELVISDHDALIFPFLEDGYKRKQVFIKLENAVFTASYIYDMKDLNTEIIFDNILNNLRFD